MTFAGFPYPEANYSKLPHTLIEALPRFRSLSELAVVLYVLRHTWGFQEFDRPKRMTLDELCNGRRRRDRSRMDGGTGLSRNAVRTGIQYAVEDAFLFVLVDDHDAARIRRSFALRMTGDPTTDMNGKITAYKPEGQNLTPGGSESAPLDITSCPPEGQNLHPRGSESAPRTEKETLERNTRKEISQDLKDHWNDAKYLALAHVPQHQWPIFQMSIDPTELVAFDPTIPLATILAPEEQARHHTMQKLQLLTSCAERTFGQPVQLKIVSAWQPPLPGTQSQGGNQ